MRLWQELAYIINKLNRGHADHDLDEEIRAHLDHEIETNIEIGISPDEARLKALRSFGSIALSKERSRNMWGFASLEILWQDIKYGLRTLLKNPGFAAVAIATMTLGIGANTAIFSLVYGVMLKPLPYAQADRLVDITTYTRGQSGGQFLASLAEIADWQRESKTFERIVPYTFGGGLLRTSDDQVRVVAHAVSTNLFSTLGASPIRGRDFTTADAEPGNPAVAIIGYTLWQKQFGGDPNVFGKTVEMDDQNYTVIGVMPLSFRFPDAYPSDLWIPLTNDAAPPNRNQRFYNAVGLLKSGVTPQQSQSEMTAIATDLENVYPESNKGWGINISPLLEGSMEWLRPALKMLLGTVALLLLIACSNIASLFLARGSAREKEIAIRAAMGASRFRLIRQTVTESLLVAIIGSVIGLLVTFVGLNSLIALMPGYIPRLADVSIDRNVLAFTLLATVFTGLICGLVPALKLKTTELTESLKQGGKGLLAGRSHGRLHGVLVITEVALSLILLVGAGLLMNSFVRMVRFDHGFDTDHVLAVNVSIPFQKYRDRTQRAVFFNNLLDRVKVIPGIEIASEVTGFPGSRMNPVLGIGPVSAVDQVNQKESERPPAMFRGASPDYFQTLKVRLVAGRFFDQSDSFSPHKVAVINQALANQLWPDGEAIGRQIIAPPMAQNTTFITGPVEVVGVIANMKTYVNSTPLEIYFPSAQTNAEWMDLIVRTQGDPISYGPAIRNALREAEKDITVESITTLDQSLYQTLALQRSYSFLLSIFAAVALSLAAVGMYGVISYSVSRRIREIGIRRALGAQKSDILKMVIGQGLVLSLIGTGLGVSAALLLNSTFKGLLYGIETTDPWTYIVVSLLLIGIVLLACYIPARRALRVDPMIALRYE